MSFPTFNNKTRQDIALGQVFTGIVKGRKSPKHDLSLGTDGYYVNKCCAQLLVNVKILNIFCMVSSD